MMTKNNFFLQMVLLCFVFQACQPRASFISGKYETYPAYAGNDLGLIYSPGLTTFKVWSPVAEKMTLKLYKQDLGGECYAAYPMTTDNGVWALQLHEDLKGSYYTFQATIDGKDMLEVTDPYAKAVGTNGQRAQVIDMAETNPEGWENDKSPVLKEKNDVILYELHVRDFSTHKNSGLKNKGKFLAFTETGSTTASGIPTGIDHIRDLGVTHVHLLPVFDYRSVDEAKTGSKQFNWGYDPQNYNVPEGSYATETAPAVVRIKEFKQMVQSLHAQGLNVVMDVVYNHTGYTDESNFNQLVPKYYYRQDSAGNYSNGSWCGNETASERSMVRKFMLESLLYWAKEYHIDGFRFDLMGNHDIETMNIISQELHAQNPNVFLYGEGWGGDPKTMADSLRAIKVNAAEIDRVAMFSDDARDGIKGHVFNEKSPGFVSGLAGQEESIKFAVVGSTQHPQVNYAKVFYAKAPWAKAPSQTINYCSAHDNHTLWDKLEISCPEATEAQRISMDKLANTIVLTSQGVPFLHAGVEFLRSKGHEHNSFQSPDSVNQLDWDLKEKNMDVFNYYKQLIGLRKQHPAFRMPSAAMIRKHLHFMPNQDGLVAYTINDFANNDSWKNIFVAFNGSKKTRKVQLPEGQWQIALANGQFLSQEINAQAEVKLDPFSAFIGFQPK